MELTYKGYNYHMVLDINSMAEIQEKIGSFSQWCEEVGKPEPVLKALIIGYTAMINEATEIDIDENGETKPFLTEKQVGRMITKYSLRKLASEVRDELIRSVNSDESKNA